MEEKILYYFGAGASANALPISKTIFDKHNNTIIKEGLLDSLFNIRSRSINYTLTIDKASNILLNNNFEEFINLSKAAKKFGDVDTYAKFLYLNNRSEFDGLKRTLSNYFTISQLIFSDRDDRYLSWLIGIMNSKDFPQNIKILSWNYDYQVELASKEFGKLEEAIHDISGTTFNHSFIKHFPNLSPVPDDFLNISLIHLNGIAGYELPKGYNKTSVFNELENKDIFTILNQIAGEKYMPHIHFAWENSDYKSELIKNIEHVVKGTTILVVIGYSFPFYNREVDKKVFNILKENGIKKIYFQDPVLDGQQLYSQFNILPHVKIEHVANTSNFHIPFEY